MKTLAILLCTVAAAAAVQVIAPFGAAGNAAAGPGFGGPAPAGPGAAAGAPGLGGAGAAGGAGGPPRIHNDFGPKVYGVGAKNPVAFGPNPFIIQRALQVANSVPNVLVRLDLNGDVTLTNQFGQEVDVVDAFGREIEID